MNCPKCGTRVTAADARYCPDCGAALSGPAGPAAAAGPYSVSSAALAQGAAAPGSGDPPYAGFWRRVGACLIDYIVVGLAFTVLSFLIGALIGGGNAGAARAIASAVAVSWLLFLFAPWLYYALMESSSHQATLGKLAVGIKVTDQSGERIGFGQATGRYFSHILTAISFGVGYAMVVFTSRRQALHDMVARTYVVRREFPAEEVAAYGPAPDAPVWMAVIAVCCCVGGGPFGIGILAAIAIPAYQDYTIRSQVVEGLTAAATAKAAVQEALAQGKSLQSINSRTLDLPSTDGLRYVREISVDGGVVTVLYGRTANWALVGERLAFIPGRVPAQQGVVWVCGHHAPPPDVTPVIEGTSAYAYTTVADKYLPRACRLGGG